MSPFRLHDAKNVSRRPCDRHRSGSIATGRMVVGCDAIAILRVTFRSPVDGTRAVAQVASGWMLQN